MAVVLEFDEYEIETVAKAISQLNPIIGDKNKAIEIMKNVANRSFCTHEWAIVETFGFVLVALPEDDEILLVRAFVSGHMALRRG